MTGLMNIVNRVMERLAAANNMTPSEFAVFRFFLSKDVWTPTALASELSLPISRVSRKLSKLADRGLLVRRRLSSDRRVVTLRLSDKGKALALQIDERVRATEATLSDGISANEPEVFASVSSKVKANYKAMSSQNGVPERLDAEPLS